MTEAARGACTARKAVIPDHTVRVLEFPALREIVASYTRTPLGRARAAALTPSADRAEIQRWLDETSEMRALADSGQLPALAGIRDIEPLVHTSRQRSTPFEPGELLDIAATLGVAEDVAVFFATHAARTPRMQAYAHRMGDFRAVQQAIERCIDNDQSVKDTASPALRELRRRSVVLRGQIQERLKRMLDAPELQGVFEERLIFSRNGRPVLAVKSSQRRAVAGTLIDKSNSGATMFVEPHAVTELVNTLEEVRIEEAREVARILWELTRMLAARCDDISATLDALGWIDLTVAKAAFSAALHMHAPVLSDDHVLDVREARHPLLLHWALRGTTEAAWEDAARAVVPLSLELGTEYDMVIITGPNTGGKTVAMKTIGLLAVMMQCGLHIPAQAGSRLPVYAPVLADIGDEQSLSQSLSTFSSHLRHITEFLHSATPHALVLLDEFGAGTDPAEGAALATAVLDMLRERRAHVVATTHLGALKTYAYTTPRVQNACMEFDLESLQPTFRMLVGQPGSSNALVIAERLGMPHDVIERAKSVLDRGTREVRELLNHVHAARTAADNSRRRAEELLAAARAASAAADERGRAAEEAAAQRIDTLMRDIRAALDDYRHAISNAPEPHGAAARTLIARIEELLQGTPRAEQQRRFAAALRPGDRVYVVPLRAYGVVQAVRARQRMLRVAVDTMVLEVPFAHVSERPDVRRAPRTVAPGTEPSNSAPPAPAAPPLTPGELSAFHATLAAGMEVYVPALRSTATVLSVDEQARTVSVRTGGLVVRVPWAKLQPVRT